MPTRSARAVLPLALALAVSACGSDDRPRAASTPHGGAGGAASSDGGAPDGGGGAASCVALAPSPLVKLAGPPGSAYEAEVSLAAQADGSLVAAYIAFGLGAAPVVAITRSTDHGATWSAPVVAESLDGRGGVDPSVTATPDGGFALAWLGVRYQGGGATDRQVYVARAPKGGAFGEPTVVSDPGVVDSWDKPWVTALDDGALLVAFTTDSGASVTVARSAKGGAFTRTSVAPDGALKATAYLCHAGAHVYLPYLVPGGIELASSDDGGATWPAANLARVSAPGDAVAFDPPTCVARGESVWVSYGVTADADSEATSPRLTAIRVARSDDLGGSFRAPADALDAAAGPYAMHPALALRGDAIDLFYYAGDDAKAGLATARLATSVDDGATFCPPATLAKGFDLVTSRSSFGWLGDYAGLASAGGATYVAFADNVPAPGTELSHVVFGAVKPKP